jgi:hypothetical protein
MIQTAPALCNLVIYAWTTDCEALVGVFQHLYVCLVCLQLHFFTGPPMERPSASSGSTSRPQPTSAETAATVDGRSMLLQHSNYTLRLRMC